MLSLDSMFEKLQTREKIPDSLEPAAIQFTLERSQESARQSGYFLPAFSFIYINGDPRKWLIILKYFLWNLMDIALFI